MCGQEPGQDEHGRDIAGDRQIGGGIDNAEIRGVGMGEGIGSGAESPDLAVHRDAPSDMEREVKPLVRFGHYGGRSHSAGRK